MKEFSFHSSILKILSILLLFFSFCLVYSCNQSDSDRDAAAYEPPHIPKDHTFVGDQTCRSCHVKEWEAWKGSHHDYAMAEAAAEMIRGDFNEIVFQDGEDIYHFYREDEKFMVEAPGPEGTPEVYEIAYTFGWEPLQQYLVDIGNGKYQALHAAWDTEQKQWFSLYQDEQIEPEEWLHWTGQSMNWNTMCADCHSTNLKQNYISEADSFHTTWDAINVSCEACHGPGSTHVNFMNSKDASSASSEQIRKDLNLPKNVSQLEEINTCAPCHSRREKLSGEYIHGDNFLDHYDPSLPHPDQYFADGQIRDEVFVYGSFLQSKMYANHVQCSDCHDPHTLDLKESITDNKLCMNCHEPSFNSPEHHFHENNIEASRCVSCHMPGRTYMGNDLRRDHSFRVPRPDLSEKFGTPNACNTCHEDQSPEWAARAIEDWYGSERGSYYSEMLAKTHAEEAAPDELDKWITDPSQPEIIRAALIRYAGQFPDQENLDILEEALNAKEFLIRISAVKAIENLPADIRRPLLTKVLEDTNKTVRIRAAQGLIEFTDSDFSTPLREPFRNALQEYKNYLDVNEYFPQAQMNRGQFFEQQGEIEKAIEAYHKTLENDPGFNPARINLAFIYNGQGNNTRSEQLLKTVIEQEPGFGQAYYSLGLLLAEQDKLEEALQYFEKAAEFMPEESRVFLNWAVALQTLNKPEQAESAYQKAIQSEPENGDYHYGIITLYMQQEQFEKAMKHAEILAQLYPENPQVQQLNRMIEQEMK